MYFTGLFASNQTLRARLHCKNLHTPGSGQNPTTIKSDNPKTLTFWALGTSLASSVSPSTRVFALRMRSISCQDACRAWKRINLHVHGLLRLVLERGLSSRDFLILRVGFCAAMGDVQWEKDQKEQEQVHEACFDLMDQIRNSDKAAKALQGSFSKSTFGAATSWWKNRRWSNSL